MKMERQRKRREGRKGLIKKENAIGKVEVQCSSLQKNNESEMIAKGLNIHSYENRAGTGGCYLHNAAEDSRRESRVVN